MSTTKTKPGRSPGRPRASEGPALDTDEALRVSLRVFAEQGYEGASVRDIARQLGVSHALLRHHFGSKMELWQRAVDASLGEMNRELTEQLGEILTSTDLSGGLRLLLVEFIRHSSTHPHNLAIILREGASGGERLDYIVEHHVQAFVTVARRLFEASQHAGALRRVPWQSVFFLVFSGGPSIYAMPAFHALLSDDDAGPADDVDAVDAYANAVADIVLHGLLLAPETDRSR